LIVRAYWLAIVVWVLDIVLIIGILTPTYYYITAYNRATEYAQQRYDPYNDFALAVLFSASFWTAAAPVVIAIFTVVLACVNGKQARLSRESINLARDEFISTHRPKIIVRNVSTIGFVVGCPVHVRFKYINIGETRGSIAAVEACVFLRPKDNPVPRGLRLQPCEIIKATLSCGEVGIGETNSSFDIEARDINPLQSGGKIICIAGYIKYRDDRGSIRRTGFARQGRHIGELRFELTPY
jgi:hypothetical protein